MFSKIYTNKSNILAYLAGFLLVLQDAGFIVEGHNIRLGLFPLIAFALVNVTLVKKRFTKVDWLYVSYLMISGIFIAASFRGFSFSIWFLINLVMLKSKNSFFLRGFLDVAVLSAIHIIFQGLFPALWINEALLSKFIFHGGVLRAFSILGEPSYAALFLSVALIAIFVNQSKQRGRLAPVLMISAIGFTYSRLGLLALGLILFYSLIKKRNFLSAVFLIFVGLCPAILNEPEFYGFRNADISSSAMLNKGSEHERIVALKRGYEIFKQDPVLGVGLGESASVISSKKPLPELGPDFYGIHNLFLEVLVEQGIIGFIFSILFLLTYIKRMSFQQVLPLGATLIFLMQFCPNINMPALLGAAMFAVCNFNLRDSSMLKLLCHFEHKVKARFSQNFSKVKVDKSF